MKTIKCIICNKGFKTEESVLAHQRASRHRIKDCDCHCHCIDRDKCNCEMLEMTVQCPHCIGKYNEEERDKWF